MRDQLAKTIMSNRAVDNWAEPLPSDFDLADTIIAALPDMVQPLVWDKHPDEQEWYCKLPEIDELERGYMVLPNRGGFALFEGFRHRKAMLGHFTLAQDARAAANTHNRRRILSAFGITGET